MQAAHSSCGSATYRCPPDGAAEAESVAAACGQRPPSRRLSRPWLPGRCIDLVGTGRGAPAEVPLARTGMIPRRSGYERGEHAIAELDLFRNAEGRVPKDPLVQFARLTRAAAAVCEGEVVEHKQVARL